MMMMMVMMMTMMFLTSTPTQIMGLGPAASITQSLGVPEIRQLSAAMTKPITPAPTNLNPQVRVVVVVMMMIVVVVVMRRRMMTMMMMMIYVIGLGPAASVTQSIGVGEIRQLSAAMTKPITPTR
jgi:hypothetical protein